MTELRRQKIRADDSPSIDAFGRWRTSELTTLFDSKQTQLGFELFWDIATTSGTGTSSVYNKNEAKTTLSVSNVTAGTIVRQTKQRMNYQPGKSQLVLLTFNLNGYTSGVTKRVGYFDNKNGIFLQSTTDLSFAIRSYATGSAVDIVATRSNWNIDKMDGTGVSGINLDVTKAQIMVMDFEWLGVGRVRVGFIVEGEFHYCHEFYHANLQNTVYMSTPNLPIRYEISNDGTGAASTLDTICATVASEGGHQRNGILRSENTGIGVTFNTSNIYALIGIRLKATEISGPVIFENLSLIASSPGDNFRWELRIDPTVAGTFTYGEINGKAAGLSYSVIESAIGNSTNTVTGGQILMSGLGQSDTTVSLDYIDAYKIGTLINGTPNRLVLCIYNFSNITIHGCMNWRELV